MVFLLLCRHELNLFPRTPYHLGWGSRQQGGCAELEDTYQRETSKNCSEQPAGLAKVNLWSMRCVKHARQLTGLVPNSPIIFCPMLSRVPGLGS